MKLTRPDNQLPNQMKKFILIFILSMGIISGYGQTYPASIFIAENPNGNGRDITDLFDCYQDALVSQPVYHTGGISSFGSFYEGGSDYLYDNILVNPGMPVNEILFWGSDQAGDGRTFKVVFYENSGGQPGTEIASFLINPERENLSGYATVYRYHAVLPAQVHVQQGDFISIGARFSDGLWYWSSSHSGDMQSYNFYLGDINQDLSFCLGYTPPVPLSPWAIFLGFGLILMVVLYRAMRH
jgi:hypothetical protein